MNIIKSRELASMLATDHPVIIDARGGADALERYNQEHLENAQFVDLETELSDKAADPASGGRHPLPQPDDFGKFLGTLGIRPASTVVVYDDKNGANAAARFWWMLKAAGHEKVYVVSGGLQAIKAAGLPVTAAVSDVKPAENYPIENWTLPTVPLEVVKDVSEKPEYLVIDVRENYRYQGEGEPIDLVAGHIPGAINIPYMSNLDEEGVFLPAAALAAKYKLAFGDIDVSRVIVHCGSGVTACHTLLALAEAGLEGASLYVGSWSEWSRNSLPMAKGE
ncbi:sulfurtransferase [Dyadobacter sandarakinus]|uniref:Sulfurtransferase n=1 Tax=Dyadobacter sandarakinus TaxID=2747268 RepID=A0ABX7I305_9BACT|nr:sulfurtransferase [Dyadobacter sandarakinus]QRQ99931.1 sulfurtransferase [Dyadobacter sandarakinus]